MDVAQSAVTGSVAAGSSVTVNVSVALSPSSPSATLASPIDRDGASSSVIVRVTFSGAVIPWLFVAVPETVTSLSKASTSLLTAVIVTTPVLVRESAGIVNVVFVLSV